MVNAGGVCRGSNSNLQSLGSGGLGSGNTGGAINSANVTTSATSALTSQHSAGGEFFYFDDDLRDFSSAGESAAQPVPAAAELIAADLDVESIERLLERLRRSDLAHGQRKLNGAEALSALLIHRHQELILKQHQNQQNKQPLQAMGSNKNTALALFGVGGQSKSDSCLAGSRYSPDGLLSGSTGNEDICGSGRELSMSWPLNDSAIVFRQYPLFADDTALMLASSVLARGDEMISGHTKSATVSSGLTQAALAQVQRRHFYAAQQQYQQQQGHHNQQHIPAVTSSTTGSITLDSELMDVLSRKHNYKFTFAGHQPGSKMNDSLASDRSHLSRASTADFGELGITTSAAAKAALLRKLQVGI